MKFLFFLTIVVIAAIMYFHPSSQKITAVKQWMSTHSGFSETQELKKDASADSPLSAVPPSAGRRTGVEEVKGVTGIRIWWLPFFGNLNQPAHPASSSNSSSSTDVRNNQAPLPQKKSASPGSLAPPGFKGPTGQPRIIGPSGPPPNY